MPTTSSSTSRLIPFRPADLGVVWLGGTVGVGARYLLGLSAPPDHFPTATLLINVAGAFLLGMLLQVLGRTGADPGRRRLVRLFGGTGILGGFTTYSALATDTVRLWQTGSPAESAGYAVGTVLLGAIASVAGIAGGALLRRRAPR